MRRAAGLLIVLGGLLLVWLVLSSSVPLRGQDDTPAKQPTTRWEYAMVAFVSGKGASWETTDGIVFGKNFEELNVKLGLPESATQSRLFTHLGKEGWELVTHSMRTTSGPQPGIHGIWTFKRPAK